MPREANDPLSAWRSPSGEMAELLGPHRIALDRDDVDPPTSQGDGDRAMARADLDDQLPRPEVGLGDETVSEFGAKKVLTETATSLVPGRPPLGGHGASPS
jgi:hypothetical protein